MDAVDKEFERVVKRQKQLHKATVDSVDGLLQKLTQAQVVVEKGRPDTNGRRFIINEALIIIFS